MREIFPPVHQLFPCKPVSTKYGDGFILGPKAPTFDRRGSTVTVQENKAEKYYVKIDSDIHEVREELIRPDPTLQDDIEVDKERLEEISQKLAEP